MSKKYYSNRDVIQEIQDARAKTCDVFLNVEVDTMLNDMPNQEEAKRIREKLKYCLGEHLIESTQGCNKHELQGEFKGYYRLHLGNKLAAVYKIVGEKPNRNALVLDVCSEGKYHNWIKY